MSASGVIAGQAAGAGFARRLSRGVRRNAWTVALLLTLTVLLAVTRLIQPTYGASGLESLAKAALPIVLASVAQAIVVIAGGIDLSIGSMMALTTMACATEASTIAKAALPIVLASVAQAIVVIAGGIDLSIGSMMALTNVTAAALMAGNSEQAAVAVVAIVLVQGLILGVVNGVLVVATKVPDIVVTLAMSFVWAGAALLVLDRPSGSAAQWLKDLYTGTLGSEWVPKAFVLMVVIVAAIWMPLQRSRAGLSLYAVGSDRLAAFRSGVSVPRTKVMSYALCGLFSAMGGIALTMATGIGTPIPGPYTLASVAAIVLGGVSLAGGRGGLFGVIVAVLVLRLVRTDLTLLGIDPNYTTVIEGLVMVVVVMVGAVVALRRRRAW